MNRRQTLKFIGTSALAASSFTACKNAPHAKIDLDISNPEHLHLMHRKLAYTLDDRLVYWNIDAVRMGFKDGILTPFWNMHVGIIYKLIPLEDFRYEVKAILKIFYTDLETGKLLEVFDNPYTGEQRPVAQPKLFKSNRVFGLNGAEVAVTSIGKQSNDKPQGPVTRKDELGPVKIIGDDVWLNADSVYRSETPNRMGSLIQVNDWSTYHGSLSEISDPRVTSAKATHTFNDLNTFNHSWIGMKGVDAWSISRGFGRKSHTVATMPETWKKFVATTNPELLTDNPGFD